MRSSMSEGFLYSARQGYFPPGAKSHEFARKLADDVVPPSLKLWRTGADLQRDGWGRSGRGYARCGEEKMRRARRLVDRGLRLRAWGQGPAHKRAAAPL